MNIVESLIEMDSSSPKNILVVGDGMTDLYIYGRLEDECQERCRKFIEERRVSVPGGASNASRSLYNWMSSVMYFGEQGHTYSPIKSRFIAGDRCIFRYDNDRTCFDLSLVRQESVSVLDKADAVLLSDYDKGTLTPDFINLVISNCAKAGIPCVVDAKRSPILYKGAIIKCNVEYQHKYGRELSELVFDAPDRNGNKLVVTAGGMNPVIWDGNGPIGLGYTLPFVKCVNYVGAGDCFAAHLTLALAHKLSLREAAAVAHSAGRVYVQYQHNRPPRPEEVAADMALAPHECLPIGPGMTESRSKRKDGLEHV